MRRSSSLSLAIAVLAVAQLGATDCGEIISDPGFDLWCGAELCSWRVDHGDVARVPTWHEGDDGIELLGGSAAIYQLTPVTYVDGACIEFEMIADIDPGVDVRFQADVYGDGSIELDLPLPAANWRPLVYRFDVVGVYEGVTFWISKRSAGRAVVAQLQARTCGAGEGSQQIASGPRPLGASCSTDDQCASGECSGFLPPFDDFRRCSTCQAGAPCADPGDVCGVAIPPQHTLAPYPACVPAASRQLGELCGTNPECTTGICAFFVCSTCFADSCGGGEICEVALEEPRTDGQFGFYPAPLVCSPRAGIRVAGEPCGSDADCASGACAGAARAICSDGRPCSTDHDCPVADGLEHGACATIGVIGGTCQ
jgi:hypothetical protein